mgnify:CR=1 FL=1
MIYLHELLPENISDESAYHLVSFLSALALELESCYFAQIRRHLESVCPTPEDFIPGKQNDDLPF